MGRYAAPLRQSDSSLLERAELHPSLATPEPHALPSSLQIYPATPEWQTTPNSVGVGDGSVPGQDRNVFDGQYQFPDYARRGGEGYRLVYIPDGMLPQFKPTGAQQLWGGQYSSVGKFPVGYRGQITDGGEWNVWALPTEEQVRRSFRPGFQAQVGRWALRGFSLDCRRF